MRKYKFRGKRLDNGEWVYGSLAETHGKLFIGIPTAPDNPVYMMDWHEVNPATLGQIAGQLDKTGIYEGDILIEPSVATIPLEVRYNEKQCAFCLIEHTHTEGPLLGTCPLGDMLRHYPFMKVAGNIHDNPEILSKWVQGNRNKPKDKS